MNVIAELVPEGKYDANRKRVGPVRVALPFQTGQETAITPLTVLTVALSVEDGGLGEAEAGASKLAA